MGTNHRMGSRLCRVREVTQTRFADLTVVIGAGNADIGTACAAVALCGGAGLAHDS